MSASNHLLLTNASTLVTMNAAREVLGDLKIKGEAGRAGARW